MTDFSQQDAEFLIGKPQFVRFLFAAIQSAGVLMQESPAHGQQSRDFHEGRRSLGFDLLHLAHLGQPEAIRAQDPQSLATLLMILREAVNPKEKTRDRRNDDIDRYSALD